MAKKKEALNHELQEAALAAETKRCSSRTPP